MTDTDLLFMGIALAEARIAYRKGNVPVGAVVVVDGSVVAQMHNRRRSHQDPTAHAEIETLRRAGQALGNWRVEGTLFVTQEPCPMCAGALVNARVKRLVYGCANPKAGAIDSLHRLVSDTRLNHRVQVTAGVRREECAELLRSFFARLRA